MKGESNENDVDGGDDDRDNEAEVVGDVSEETLESLMELGDYATASKHCTALLRALDAASYERRAKLLLKRSSCLKQTGQLKRAIADAEECRLMQVKGLEGETLFALADLYESRESFEKALECLQQMPSVTLECSEEEEVEDRQLAARRREKVGLVGRTLALADCRAALRLQSDSGRIRLPSKKHRRS